LRHRAPFSRKMQTFYSNFYPYKVGMLCLRSPTRRTQAAHKAALAGKDAHPNGIPANPHDMEVAQRDRSQRCFRQRGPKSLGESGIKRTRGGST
jgi:hypothetical protein